MAIPDADQIALIRLSVGDGCEKIADWQIEAAYAAAEGDECGTNALIARWLWMSVRPATITLVNGGTAFSRTLVDIYKERMDYWQQCAGTGLATLTTGMIALGIDVTEADLTDASATWLWGE